MNISVFLTLACALWQRILASQFTPKQKASLYKKCKEGDGIYQGNVISRMTSKRLRCFEECTVNDRCKSLNVCPSNQKPETWDCELLDGYSPWFCKQLHAAPHPKCFHAEKVTRCHNGGREKSDGTCKCDLCFKGTNCNEHVRDCHEAVEILAADGGYDEAVTCAIKPTNSPEPFQVICPFTSTDTLILMRVQTESGWSQLDWKAFNWTDYKTRMGSYNTYNFFVGLENLRHFLSQAEYRLNMFNNYQPPVEDAVSPSYRNLTLQNEANKYALAYSVYTSSDLSSTDVDSFHGPRIPHPFCTIDNDCGNCAEENGPGWYYLSNGNCIGASPFGKIAKWKYDDQGLLTLYSTEYFMERVGNFY